MTKKRDEVVVPATAAELRAVAMWIDKAVGQLRRNGPSLLGDPKTFEEDCRADEQVAVRLGHLARWSRTSVHLPKADAERIGAMGAMLLLVHPSLDLRVFEFIVRCSQASATRRGRPRLTRGRVERRVSQAGDHPEQDERTIRRLKSNSPIKAVNDGLDRTITSAQ